jgi:AcrR family transcriptional regulator
MTRKLAQIRKANQRAPTSAQDPRSVRSREALHRAFLALLEAKDLHQITVQEITAVAGLSYVTFFRYHATKESLLHEIAAEQIQRLVELSLPVLEAVDSHAASLAMCSYVDEHRGLWSVLLTGGAAAAMREEYIRVSGEVAESRENPAALLPTDIAGTLFVSSTLELLAWWLRQEKPLPVERIAAIHDRVITTPLIQLDTPAGDIKPARARRKS